jgi:sugar (pentulose or hexulose) kinase
MKQQVTAVFDIGKTNKKFFLFDQDFHQVFREYASFEPVYDEDGYPTEDLAALQSWLKGLFNRILNAEKYQVKAINFSSYGASFVHLDENGEVLTPLYNYTKPIDQQVVDCFFARYGPQEVLAQRTGSPDGGLLSSGLQLYWLKHSKPEIWQKVRYSLHLPQYLNYIFTGIPLSEYTSIGCHTGLWDYEKKDYHAWVYTEEIHKKLPPIVSTETSINMNYNGRRMQIGMGIHDSSAAMIPYIRSISKPFILVSTGTWSIALNPFADHQLLSATEIQESCLNYMRINGKAVKATRLFIGNEYNLQVKKLVTYFGVPADHHMEVKFNEALFYRLSDRFSAHFKWESLGIKQTLAQTRLEFDSFEEALHQLMIELVLLQVAKIKTVLGQQQIENLYIDGGFSDNDIFIKLLSHYLRDMTLHTTSASLGSAVGAAICISDTKLNAGFLEKNYSLKKHFPFIFK